MTLIEMLADRKRKAAPPPTESAVALPMLEKEHEGACGEGCGCGAEGADGCCGG